MALCHIDYRHDPFGLWHAIKWTFISWGTQLQEESIPGGPDDWLFPSENPKMPIGADNMMARYIRPKVRPENVGFGWVYYRVMRRTHSSLMNAGGVDPKLIAYQQGHTVDVNLNIYTNINGEPTRSGRDPRVRVRELT